MLYEQEKSDSLIVAVKSANKPVQTGAESMEPRGGGRGERGRATHVPDTEPGKRVPGASPCTANSEGKEEGTVLRSAPSCNYRHSVSGR